MTKTFLKDNHSQEITVPLPPQNTKNAGVMIHSSQCSPKAVQISLNCSASVSSNNICDRKLKIMGAVQAEEKWYEPVLLHSLSARAPQQIFINATVTVWLCHPNRLLILCGVALVENERIYVRIQSGPFAVLSSL